MRITFVLPHIRIGGGVRSTLELANRLQDRGHDVTVVYPWSGVLSGSAWYNCRKMARGAFYSLRRLLGGDLRARGGAGSRGLDYRKGAGRFLGPLRSLISAGSVDWLDMRATVLRVPTLAERSIPDADIIVATWWANAREIHNYGPDKGEKFHFIRHYEIWGGPEDLVNATYFLPLHKLVTSTWLKKLVEEKFGVPVLGPLPNGVNFDLFYREGEVFESHRPKRVGLLYRRQKWKGMGDGLRAFLIANKEFPGIRLVLFGVEPAPDDMALIRAIGDIEYHRLPTGDALRKIYNSLDIFVFPSHCEGFGNPPMEAMACGVACVATDVGAVRDYSIPGETALVSQPKDVESLSRNILLLLRDEERRRKMAGAGHAHIKKFTWESTTDELEQIFLRYANPTCNERNRDSR